MKKENNQIYELSKFVLGEIYYKKNGKVKSTRINKIGYLITENEESYIYDFVDNVVIDLYDQNNFNRLDEGNLFSIVNRPWENSNKFISPRELDEVIEILKKRVCEFDAQKRRFTKYPKRESTTYGENMEYRELLNRKSAHQKRLINTKLKQEESSKRIYG